MTYSAHIFNAGTIKINTTPLTKGGFDITGAIAAYEFETVEALVDRVNDCQWVERPSGKIEKAEGYSVRKAKFDFK